MTGRRRWLLALAVVAALLVPAAASAQGPAPPGAAGEGLPPLKPEHILAGVVGVLVGDAVLHSTLGLPSALSLVAGGIAGYYVYIRYIEPGLESGARRISAAADDARVHLIGLRDRAGQTAADLYGRLSAGAATVF